MRKKRALVLGGAGFIGGHLCQRLLAEEYSVLAVDRALPEFVVPGVEQPVRVADLTTLWPVDVLKFLSKADEVYQLACEVGGLGWIHDKNNDAVMLRNSVQINLNCLEAVRDHAPGAKVLYTSSACVYPSTAGECKEADAWPYQGDNFYAHEKWFSEQLYDAYARNYGLDIRIVRPHNCMGPYHTYDGGREKAPAAICRKVAQAPEGGEVEVWGDGEQTRSFMYIDDCIEGIRRLMSLDWDRAAQSDATDFTVGPVNLGSSEMVTINKMTDYVIGLSGKALLKKHVPGEQGVRGRSSDNTLLKSLIDWEPSMSLAEGLARTYPWVAAEVERRLSHVE